MGSQGVELVAQQVAETPAVPTLPDLRLQKRRARVIEVLRDHPDQSYPQALGTDGDIEGFYRLVENRRVRPQGLLGPHYEEVVQRAASSDEVLIISDTTKVTHQTATLEGGFGPLSGGKKLGYHVHAALAVDAETHTPLGTLAMENWARKPRTDGGGKRNADKRWKAPDKESLRWLRTALTASKRLGDRARAIHVMDREADSYELFSALVSSGDGFVIRGNHDRKLASGQLSELAEAAETKFERSVYVSKRQANEMPAAQRKHPPRKSRWTRLSVKAFRVVLQSPPKLPDLPEQLELSLVYVVEEEPPEGEEPICWTLLTTEPVDTLEQIARVVDVYRGRWLIEEFFKAIKTGCRFEERLFESVHTSANALAVTMTFAYKMLVLRQVAQEEPTVPAKHVLDADRISLLRAIAKTQLDKRDRLPPRPTVADVLHVIARLGGFLRHNRRPGWLVLGRGWQKFLFLEAGDRMRRVRQGQAVSPVNWDLMAFEMD